MATDKFTFTDAGEIVLAPFMYREKQADAVRAADHAREAARTSGVSWSGMGAEPYRGRTEAEQRIAAQAAYEQVCTFGQSPRARFLLLLRSLEALGYVAEAEAVRSAMCRGFMDERKPASPPEVACALLMLVKVSHSHAREAIAALAEILAGSPQQRAA